MPPSGAIDAPPADIPLRDPIIATSPTIPAGVISVAPTVPQPQSGGPRWSSEESWTWQNLPPSLLYPAYWAGPKESRIAAVFANEMNDGWFLQPTLGGYVGLWRYGSTDPLWPEGWQIDMEGAVFPRIALEHDLDLVSSDYRFGFPLTYRQGLFEAKLAYYHLSSHLGDEYLFRINPQAMTNDYSRETIVLGLAIRPWEALRLYAETGWAVGARGPAEAWEFQFGADFSPATPGFRGAPFLAVNARLRQEVDFGGSLTVQTGWLWRGQTGKVFRTGLEYFNGKSEQMEFVFQHEQHLGLGFWYDY